MKIKQLIISGLILTVMLFVAVSCSDKSKMGSYRKYNARENASSRKKVSYESKKPKGRIPVSGNYKVRERYSDQ